MESEMQSKHCEKKKLWQDIQSLNIQLKTSLNLIIYNTLIHENNISIKSQLKVINLCHEKKLIKFYKKTTKNQKM